MLSKFYPDRIENSTYDIDFEKLYNDGKRGIIFDIDNTLVNHGADANDSAKELLARLHLLGFKVCLLSNNNKERVERFNKEIGAFYIFKAAKPKSKGYLKACEIMELDPDEVIFIGDQLFTDVWGAKNSGIDNILVGKLDKKEAFQVVLKRIPEKAVLHFYNRKKGGK